jgi:DNA repair exonuclease SbcCD nuclease subunit
MGTPSHENDPGSDGRCWWNGAYWISSSLPSPGVSSMANRPVRVPQGLKGLCKNHKTTNQGVTMFFISKSQFQAIIEKAVNKALEDSESDKKKALALREQIANLTKEKQTATDELEALKLQKKHELRDIEHMVKLREEKQAVELERKTVAMQKEFQTKEMTLQTEGHAKIMAMLEKGREELSGVYKQIIERLPNVNMEIKRGV